ncbi:hypothetical protein ICG_04532 [Bacillus cereus BAG1X1-3]|nr:hypothetical protein ICG_04532 [Bacillus cereus BAG1X1-3]EOO80250.1 hypothetical protein IC7_00231 [Bacillus cereus BAG1O-1]MDR4172895.1 hypothetical protein [Bacillus nitratireducens]
MKEDGLYITLGEIAFKPPETGEVIELYFQKRNGGLPIVTQKPDTLIAIEKNGKSY